MFLLPALGISPQSGLPELKYFPHPAQRCYRAANLPESHLT
jgi:hypothetical protein